MSAGGSLLSVELFGVVTALEFRLAGPTLFTQWQVLRQCRLAKRPQGCPGLMRRGNLSTPGN